MRVSLVLPLLALATSLTVGGAALAADPPGSTPSSPPAPAPDPGPTIPEPPPQRGPTQFGIEFDVPPPLPGGLVDPSAADDAAVDALLGIGVPLPPPSFQSFATDDGEDWHAYLETGSCTWTNDNVASCEILSCDDDGVCVQVGTYCQDHYGNDVPCP